MSLVGKRTVFLGFGSVAQCLLPMLVKEFGLELKSAHIVDSLDRRQELQNYLNLGLSFSQVQLNKDNLTQYLHQWLTPGTLVIDLTVNVDTKDILLVCRDRKALYINASLENWMVPQGAFSLTPQEQTLYHRHQEILPLRSLKTGPTAVLDHGANPGLVSHFLKKGLLDLATHYMETHSGDSKVSLIKKLTETQDFPRLAQALEVRTIHISEKDSQIGDYHPGSGEFINTWSVEGFLEEALAPAELGWGTHETGLPPQGLTHHRGPKNQICLNKNGSETLVRSWVPSQEIQGMMIRHGEAYTISEYFTLMDRGEPVYRPTVHYVYDCNPLTKASLIKMSGSQSKSKILREEIKAGGDVLGVLLLGSPGGNWWCGSDLDIDTARNLVPGHNATLVQVAAGIVSGLKWMVENPDQGILFPDELPWESILETAKPFLGNLISTPAPWPINGKEHQDWKLHNFLVD